MQVKQCVRGSGAARKRAPLSLCLESGESHVLNVAPRLDASGVAPAAASRSTATCTACVYLNASDARAACVSAAASGAPAPQWLRKGGVKGGTVLQDSQTLEQCGLSQDMSIWEVRCVGQGSQGRPLGWQESTGLEHGKSRSLSEGLPFSQRRRTPAPGYPISQPLAGLGRKASRQRSHCSHPAPWPQHLWADSASNQEQFEEEYAKARRPCVCLRPRQKPRLLSLAPSLTPVLACPQVLSYVSTQRDFLNSRAA